MVASRSQINVTGAQGLLVFRFTYGYPAQAIQKLRQESVRTPVSVLHDRNGKWKGCRQRGKDDLQRFNSTGGNSNHHGFMAHTTPRISDKFSVSFPPAKRAA